MTESDVSTLSDRVRTFYVGATSESSLKEAYQLLDRQVALLGERNIKIRSVQDKLVYGTDPRNEAKGAKSLHGIKRILIYRLVNRE